MTTPPPVPSWAAQPQRGAPTPGSPLDRQLEAFVGPRWETYRRKFAPFFEDARFQPTWNWSAALTTVVGPFWFIYRKLYVPALLFWIAPSLVLGILWQGGPVSTRDILADTETSRDLRLLVVGVQLSMVILAGGTANFLLFRRAQAALRLTAARGAGTDETIPFLARLGQVNRTAVLVVFGVMVVGFALLQQGAGR